MRGCAGVWVWVCVRERLCEYVCAFTVIAVAVGSMCVWVCGCVGICVCERETEIVVYVCVGVCLCVALPATVVAVEHRCAWTRVCVRERQRESECVYVCVCSQ